MNRINHRDIASQLGLSQSTVSRALHDHPSIPVETRKRIKALARKMGYRPNTLMSDIASDRWQRAQVAKGSIIGYIDTIESKTYVAGLDLRSPLQDQASSLGYNLAVLPRSEFSTSAKLQRALRSRGITDVILGPIYEQSLMINFDWSKFICVQVSPGLFRLPLHSVTKDHFNSVVLAWQKAVNHGYRRIGIVLLNHPVQIMDDVYRNSAVHACQHDLFGHLPKLAPFYFGMNEARVEGFVRWCNAAQPEAIIGFSSAHYEIFRSEFHFEIPYVSLHKNEDDDKMSGISEQASDCAREAVNLLHFCRRTHQWGIPRQRIDHVVEPAWFEGSTLPWKNETQPDL